MLEMMGATGSVGFESGAVGAALQPLSKTKIKDSHVSVRINFPPECPSF
jgi:hypothetical protein